MAVQLSPGVVIEEKDFSVTVQGATTSVGGFAGIFSQGPMGKIINISTSEELETIFGKPTVDNRSDFYIAKQFLRHSQTLRVIRVTTSSSMNAVSGTTPLLVKNRDDYDALSPVSGNGTFIAKNPGEWANGIEVHICPAVPSVSTGTPTGFYAWVYKDKFTEPPTSSAYATARNRSNDEVHVIVVDKAGKITGTAGRILEIYPFLSQASDALGTEGQSIYYKNVINNQSNYVYFGVHPSELTNSGQVTTAGTSSYVVGTTAIVNTLAGGVTDNTPTASEYNTAYNLFLTEEILTPDILICPTLPSVIDDARSIANNLISIAETRKDLVVVISPPTSVTVGKSSTAQFDDVLSFYGIRGASGNITRSTYAVCNVTAVQVEDGYNGGGTYFWIPSSGNDAGCLASTDRDYGVAAAPANPVKGLYRGVSKISFNPTKAQQDVLAPNGLNYTLQNKNGIYISNDKTFTARASTFDQIGVRRTFIYLEKIFAEFARNFLFEFNDDNTRLRIKQESENILRRQVGKIISGFSVQTQISGGPNDLIVNYRINPINSVRYIYLGFYNMGQSLQTELTGE